MKSQTSRSVILVALLVAGFAFQSIAKSEAGEAPVFSVRDYGAVGNGKALDTSAIAKTIDACAGAGGGQVVFPPGQYLSGTFQLKSDISLVLQAGATLVGTQDLGQYFNYTQPDDKPGWNFDNRWHRALILGVGLERVAITGDGTIDGAKVFDARGEERMRGPHAIFLGGCRDVSIRGVHIKDAANYAILMRLCNDVDVRGIKVTGGWDAVHFRGVQGDPCRNVTIKNCEFFTGDDCIAGSYWENTLITDCVINSSCNGIRLIGPAKGLVIHDCLMYGPGRYPHRTQSRHNMLGGILLQPGAWERMDGELDNVLISDVTMRNVTSPLHFSLKPGNTAGDITVERVTASGVYRAAASVESWAEGGFGDVLFRDVRVEFTGGGKAWENPLAVKAPGVDARPLPAWGLYARKVKQLKLEDVRLTCREPDARLALICDQVGRLVLDDFHAPKTGLQKDDMLLNDVGEAVSMDTELTIGEPEK